MTASKFADLHLPASAAARGLPAEFVRYFACSALALAADFGVYSVALILHLAYPVAAALGFVLGLWVAYSLSVRYAFRERSQRNAATEFAIFAAIGVFGLLLTEAMLWLFIGRMELSAYLAKLCTAGLVFLSNFGLRKMVLFTRRKGL